MGEAERGGAAAGFTASTGNSASRSRRLAAAAGAQLQPTSTATSVRVREGSAWSPTVRSRKPASSLAATIWSTQESRRGHRHRGRIPAGRMGTIEVRPYRGSRWSAGNGIGSCAGFKLPTCRFSSFSFDIQVAGSHGVAKRRKNTARGASLGNRAERNSPERAKEGQKPVQKIRKGGPPCN